MIIIKFMSISPLFFWKCWNYFIEWLLLIKIIILIDNIVMSYYCFSHELINLHLLMNAFLCKLFYFYVWNSWCLVLLAIWIPNLEFFPNWAFLKYQKFNYSEPQVYISSMSFWIYCASCSICRDCAEFAPSAATNISSSGGNISSSHDESSKNMLSSPLAISISQPCFEKRSKCASWNMLLEALGKHNSWSDVGFTLLFWPAYSCGCASQCAEFGFFFHTLLWGHSLRVHGHPNF